jgi:hypothetical protein
MATLLTGTGAPTGGSDGDVYLATDSGAVHFKAGGAWALANGEKLVYPTDFEVSNIFESDHADGVDVLYKYHQPSVAKEYRLMAGHPRGFKAVVWNRQGTANVTVKIENADSPGTFFTVATLGSNEAALLSSDGTYPQFIAKVAGTLGEANTASNLGGGTGVFASKSGVDLRFKSLVAGANMSLSSDANTITLTSTGAAGGGGSIPTLGDYGGVPNSTVAGNMTANVAALNAVPTGGVVLITGGEFHTNANVTIDFHLVVAPGSKLSPQSGTTITFSSTGYTLGAGPHQIFGGSGALAGVNSLVDEAIVQWFRGGDLGAQFNDAFASGAKRLYVPHKGSGAEITTPVSCPRDVSVRGDGMFSDVHSYINCRTNGKAVFEIIADTAGLMLNVTFKDLTFVGSTTDTPACLFFVAAGPNNGFCAGHRFERIAAHKSWGVSILYEVSAEECRVRDCLWRIYGHGDYGASSSPRRGALVFTHAHVASELTSNFGKTPTPRSHSAWSVIGGEYSYRYDWDGAGSSVNGAAPFVLLNSCWDMTFLPDYIDCGSPNGAFFILDFAGLTTPDIYGIRMGQLARTEGLSTTPFLRVDDDGKTWPMRGITMTQGSHHADSPFIVGETGDEQLENFSILPGWLIYNSNVLMKGFGKVTYSDITMRGRQGSVGTAMQIQNSAGTQITLGTLQGGAGNYVGTNFNLSAYNSGTPFRGS